MSKWFIILFIFSGVGSFAQNCSCEKEFLYVKHFIEQNYAGFKDKQLQMTKVGYQKMTRRLQMLSRNTSENCLLVILQYLDSFKDQHIHASARFDFGKYDTAYINQRQPMNLTDKKIRALSKADGIEGVYTFIHDSSYRIAVIKDRSLLHDYIGVTIDSKLPTWRKGLLKFEAKQVNDSLLKGILYMRNHMPKVEWFDIGKNRIGGDWQREVTTREKHSYSYVPVAAEKLSDKVLYLKISSFSPSNAKNIDSLLKAHQKNLTSMPYLILDLRDNSGGADFSFNPILPYICTGPVKNIGVDVLATESNISGWKKLLDDKDLPEQNRNTILGMIKQMELNKGKLVSIEDDNIDSSCNPLSNPKKVVVLINRRCASTTEQFLLYARQSSKVILMGENTQGTLDYSNMREASFSCLPYVLHYSTTRSRRLNTADRIDNIGIKPQVYLKKDSGWVDEVIKLLEQ